ncbi:MAG: hypothetical protein JXR68_00860 [Bacteroidales bacterium]|nr:hypothetical protein [Bacteroidales bacterium]
MKYFIVLIFSFLLACQKDTCNESLGSTFMNVQLDSLKIDINNDVDIKLKLSTLDALPLNYFTDFNLILSDNNPQGYWWHNAAPAIDTIFVNNEKIQFTILNDSLPIIGTSLKYDFHLVFPDRRNYISCEHLGSSDCYYLDFSFVLKKVDTLNYQISDFYWDETLNKGGF